MLELRRIGFLRFSRFKKAKLAFDSIEFSKCLGKCDFIEVLDLKSIFSLV